MNLHVIWRCWFLFFEKKRWALFVILRQLWLWTVLAPWLMSFQRQTWRLIESRAMIDSISEANMAPEPIHAPWLIQFQRKTWRLANPRAMIDAISEVNMAPHRITRHDWCYFRGKHGAWANPRAMIDAISEANMAHGQSTRHDWSNFRDKHGAWPIHAPWLIQFQRQTWRLTNLRAMIDSISKANMAPDQSTRHDWFNFRGKHGARAHYGRVDLDFLSYIME